MTDQARDTTAPPRPPAGPTLGGNGKPPSLLDGIDTAESSTTKASDDANKTTAMKADGVKPITALGPIAAILGLVFAFALWKVSPIAALIVGLVAVSVLVLWLFYRKYRNRHPSRTQHHNARHARRSLPWLQRRRERHNAARHNGSPHSPTGRDQRPWRQRHWRPSNPFRREPRKGDRPNTARTEGQYNDDSQRRRRRPWRPFGSRSRNGSHTDGYRSDQRHGDTRRPERSRWNPFTRRRSGNRTNSGGIGGSSGGHDRGKSGSPYSSNGKGRHRWHKPWTWRGGHYNGHSGGGHNRGSGPVSNGNGSEDSSRHRRRRRLKAVFRRLWDRQLYDPSEETVNGQYDPDRRSWSHDWWNRTRTNRQRQNVNYDGFEVDGEGNARPHYTRYEKFSSRWGRRQRRFRNWFRRTGQQEPWNWEGYGDRSADYDQTPPRRWVPSWRSDRPTPMPTPGLVSNAEQLPTRGPELSSGTQSLGVSAASNPTTRGKGSEMSDNGSNGGSAPNTVAGRLEAMAYEAGSANAHRSAVWHVAVANQLRAWAARLSNSDNPYHRASASTYALMAARANEVALNDARLAAVQKGQAQRAIGSGQQATD